MVEKPLTGKLNHVFPLILCLAISTAYSNSLDGVFLFDDAPCIENNLGIRSLASTWEGADIPGGLERRVIPRWSLALTYAFSGLETWGYHLVNIGIHLCSALLLFGICNRCLQINTTPKHLKDNAGLVALCIALLWGLHPLQTQAVTYIIQRIEALMALFYLATLYFVLRGSQATRPWPWYASAITTCCLGMASKEVMVTAPFVIVFFDRIYLAGSWSALLRRRGVVYLLFMVSAGFLLAQANVMGKFKSPDGNAAPSDVPKVIAEDNPLPKNTWEHVRTQPEVLLHYLRLTVWPSDLVMDYGWPVQDNYLWISICGSIVLALLVATLLALTRFPKTAFLGISFFAILAPTSLVRLNLAFEHRMYLPLAALAALFVLGVIATIRIRVPDPKRAMIACVTLCAIIALIVGKLTYDRNEQYRNHIVFWSDNVEKRPNNSRALVSLTKFMMADGQYAESIPLAQRAIELNPLSSRAHANLATCYREQGDLERAAKLYAEAIRLNPRFPDFEENAALVYYQLGDLDAAIKHFERTLEITPKNTRVMNNLGLAWQAKGDKSKALQLYQSALKINPNLAEGYLNIGNLAFEKQPDAALEYYRKAIQLNPQYASAYHAMGLVMEIKEKFSSSVKYFEAAIRLRPNRASYYRSLAKSLAKLGRNREAESSLRTAQELESRMQ